MQKTPYISALLALTLWLSAALVMPLRPAAAADLKRDIEITEADIWLSDLFSDLSADDRIVMQAPPPGQTRTISIHELSRLARDAGFSFEKPSFVKGIKVERRGHLVSDDDIADLLMRASGYSAANGRAVVRLFGTQGGIMVPTGMGAADIIVSSVQINARQDRLSAEIRLPLGGNRFRSVDLTGQVTQMRSVPVLKRSVAAGDTVTAADIGWQEIAERRLRARMIQSRDQLVGKQARRPLRPGLPLLDSDIYIPQAVKKGASVTISLSVGNLSLATVGRALDGGVIGDVIKVMNKQSKKTVSGLIVAEGLVEVDLSAPVVVASR